MIGSKDSVKIIQEIRNTHEADGVGIPKYYLGGYVSSGESNGAKYISTSAETYIKQLMKKIERIMSWDLRKYNAPEDLNCHPELD